MTMSANQVRDKKTGRVRRKDPMRVRAARKAARTRGKQVMSGTQRRAIKMGVRAAIRTGRTADGRRSLLGR